MSVNTFGLNIKFSPEKMAQQIFTPSKPRPNAAAVDRDLTAEELLERQRAEQVLESDCTELLILWVDQIGGHFRSHGVRGRGVRGAGKDFENSFSGPQQLQSLLDDDMQGRFKDIKLDGDSRPWSTRLSKLADSGLVVRTKHGYFPSNISAEAKRIALLRYEQRIEDLRKRAPVLAYEIECYMEEYSAFGKRCERKYFQKGSVDGLAPVTAVRRMVNESHIISKKIANIFGLPILSGAGNILLEECSVNQARADGLIYSHVDEEKITYNVPRPNEVSYHIQKLHGREIKLPKELKRVLTAAIKLANHLEDFVNSSSVSPESELYRAMRSAETPEVVAQEGIDTTVCLSEQPQEAYEIPY